jgi:TonB family protein
MVKRWQALRIAAALACVPALLDCATTDCTDAKVEFNAITFDPATRAFYTLFGRELPRYPREACRLRQEGQVVVAFGLRPDGTIDAPRIDQSSGSPSIDAETLSALQRIESAGDRLPDLAARYARSSETIIRVPIGFQLQ